MLLIRSSLTLHRENGGLPPWQNRAPYERWSPNNFVHEWSTPALIIHGGKGTPILLSLWAQAQVFR